MLELNAKRIVTSFFAPFLISALVFLYFQLQIYNLGLGFRDEGFLYLNAIRLLNGEIPYRDFFLTTTPGSYFILALLLKLFGDFLVLSRIVYMMLVVVILFIVNSTYRLNYVTRYVVLISLGIIFLGPSAIGFYNIWAVATSITAFYFLDKGLNQKKALYIYLTGLLIGLTFFFKQSYGIWIGLGFLIMIALETYKKYRFKRLLIYLAGGLTLVVPFCIYLYLNNAISQFVYYSSTFAAIVKAHRTPFVVKSLLSLPLIYLSFMLFKIKIINDFIKTNWKIIIVILLFLFSFFVKYFVSNWDLSKMYYVFFLLFPVGAIVLTKTTSKTIQIKRASIFLLCIFLANASSGREVGVVMWVSPIFFPVVGLLGDYLVSRRLAERIIYYFAVTFIFVQSIYFSQNALNPRGMVYHSRRDEVTESLPNEWTKGIKLTQEEVGSINPLLDKMGTYSVSKKLLCFPYCPLLNVLTERPSPSYFNLFYNETFLEKDQQMVIDALEKSQALVVIQKKGVIEQEAGFENVRLNKLLSYINKNYKKDFENSDFILLKQNEKN